MQASPVQISVEQLSPVVVEFSVEVPKDRVKNEVDREFTRLARTAHVRGYRPGKAPRQVLAHLFSGRVYADVAQRLVDETLNQALFDKSVQPLSKPAIAPGELSPENAFAYKARFEVRPEVAEVKWEALPVKRPAAKVEDSLIDAELERLRREQSTLQAPDPERGAVDGDVVTMSFTLEVDGKEQTTGDQSVDVEVGKGEMMKELEDALRDAKNGDKKDVTVDFPSGHPNPELRGKKAVFKITVKEIKERVLPSIDDEFAKDCGDFASVDALKADIREKFEKVAKQRQSEQVAEQIVVELCKANPIAVPPSLVEQQAAVTEREFVQNARRSGQRLDTSGDWRGRVRADAEVKVRAGLLMAEIAKTREIKVDDADIEKGYSELAEQTGKNVSKLKAEYRDPKKREMLIAMILEDKILDLLEGAAKVEEVETL